MLARSKARMQMHMPAMHMWLQWHSRSGLLPAVQAAAYCCCWQMSDGRGMPTSGRWLPLCCIVPCAKSSSCNSLHTLCHSSSAASAAQQCCSAAAGSCAAEFDAAACCTWHASRLPCEHALRCIVRVMYDLHAHCNPSSCKQPARHQASQCARRLIL